MGQALYRQYRPRSLAEVVGQEHITETLSHALKQGKMAHAYLLTGPRGVGKTSIARILAYEINGLPYDEQTTHLDIIEIDAASNRRIDEIRDLRDKVNIAPSSAKYKVYIIDEVHMLTREAFNALLKTLEEPPAHAVFILATTEAHKLPETIVSRTQRFIFRPVDLAKVTAHLRTIADAEKMTISDEALRLVAAYGEGSFRDSISLLDQTRGHNGDISSDTVRSIIGVPTDEAIDALCTALATADSSALVQTLSELRQKGFSAPQVAKALGQRMRADVLTGTAYASALPLMKDLLDVPTAHNPDTYLELCLLSHTLAGKLTPAPQAAPATPTVAQPPVASRQTAVTPLAVNHQPPPTPPQPPVKTADQPPTPAQPAVDQPSSLGRRIPVDDKLWPAVLDELRKTHNTLYGIIRMAQPAFYQGGLQLGFTFPFHKKRVAENKNKDVICAVIKDLTGQDIAVHCVLIDKDKPSESGIPDFDDSPALTIAEKPQDPAVAAISSIFGGAEILDK